MPDNNQTNTPTTNPPAPVGAAPTPDDAPVAIIDPAIPDNTTPDNIPADTAPDDADLLNDIAGRIAEAHNILIALSSDPSVDEMASAIGLSLCLDRAGKRATAIYSGATPNALEFLKPEDTFEATADTLQDFVIAINKDKADHLRYKLDGDYVKIFITPYKTRIDEDDFEFSYGDFNIDLVLALNVPNGVDLDSALREHGRIMHDATVINITTGNPGKFGEIEWSDKSASSVSEMVSRLLFTMNRKLTVEKDDATAFLTGIIAATNRFSNAHTTPNSMKIASELLKLGANQELISENISDDINNNYNGYFASNNNNVTFVEEKGPKKEPTVLDIEHRPDEDAEEKAEEKDSPTTEVKEPELSEPVKVEPSFTLPSADAAPTSPAADSTVSATEAENSENVVAPSADFSTEPTEEQGNKYGQMLEAALAESEPVTPAPEPTASASVPEPTLTPEAAPAPAITAPEPASVNPAASFAPQVAAEPEINGVPEMNYSMPADILPPPPAPPIDTMDMLPQPPMPPSQAMASAAPIAPAAAPSSASVEQSPATPPSAPAAPSEPGAFNIPTPQNP